MLEIRPLDNVVRIQPQTKVLLPDYYIKFSNNWPSDLDFVAGKTFRIDKTQMVNYQLSYILPEGVYYDMNISNDDTALRLYPDEGRHVYETIIGFKPGNYYALIYFPADYPVLRLDYSTMTPTLTDPSLKYLGMIRPEDSPEEQPILRIYTVFRMKPVFIRLIADDGVAYEKATVTFNFNRMLVSETNAPPGIAPKVLPYLDEIKWLSSGPGGGV